MIKFCANGQDMTNNIWIKDQLVCAHTHTKKKHKKASIVLKDR